MEVRLGGERLPQCGVGSGGERAAESGSGRRCAGPSPGIGVGAAVRCRARANADAARGSCFGRKKRLFVEISPCGCS